MQHILYVLDLEDKTLSDRTLAAALDLTATNGCQAIMVIRSGPNRSIQVVTSNRRFIRTLVTGTADIEQGLQGLHPWLSAFLTCTPCVERRSPEASGQLQHFLAEHLTTSRFDVAVIVTEVAPGQLECSVPIELQAPGTTSC